MSSHSTDKGPVVDDTAQEASGNSVAADIRISFKRWLVKNLRNPYVIFTSLVQPIIFFVLFVEVFGAIAGSTLSAALGPDISYVTYLSPAIIIMSTLSSAATSGIGLVDDMEEGMFEKMLVSPMNRSAMFFGKVLSEVARIVVQTVIVLLLGYLLLVLKNGAAFDQYLRTGAAGIVGVVLVTVIFGGAFMAYSNIVALVSRDQEATIMFTNLLTFPLVFVSSAFLPLSVLPGWIRTVAVFNPITYGVDSVRAIMLGQDVMTVFEMTAFGGIWNTVVPAVVILVGFNVLLGSIAIRLLRRAASIKVQ
ncbi:ABC transporter permease [Haloarcula pellucida]|uniref:Transport permease protein n=1 Tax=Haloarcula pellucida TaxID=1427151 RepID=A0A830GKV4_9EURY|nr:ABC transporter permease [Halomicroarcula pellucida]MBX0350020.1 ABC transporter permease [Halomicroarcula pellucida]GGN95550.1 transport permease protein [Halomicroarcula pellucida]